MTPKMPLVGGRLGVYEIHSLIGAGGMGEVYRARDTTLGREVAIKTLPRALTADPGRLARLVREARVLASLDHPNIAIIHGFEEGTGTHALVLELVEGPTLADRIAQGPIPLQEALTIALQIAGALEAAHEHGIVHRDLKPANIKLRPDGTVKVLDFGLAKALTGDAYPDLSQSPTITVDGTGHGIILGTAAYMSPEQARGQLVDKRTDIWAFGCVVYQMLTGRAAFAAQTVSDTIAAVLDRDPDWDALPSAVPVSIRVLLRRCLEKDRKQRVSDISTALFLIKEPVIVLPAASANPATAAVASRQFTRQRIVSHGIALLVGGILIAAVAVWLVPRSRVPRVSRTVIVPSSGTALMLSGGDRDVAITPDGTHVVYVGGGGSLPKLIVRPIDRLEGTPLPEAGAPRNPFLSPDGQWIGFFDGTDTLKKIPISGGTPVTLCRVDGGGPRGASWGPDGTIVFATNNPSSGLQRVSAAGGEPTVLTTPNRERGEGDHVWPEFLPDGRAVVFTISSSTTASIDNAAVAVLDLRTGIQKVLVQGGTNPSYLASGHLVYANAGTVRAVAFDSKRLALVGAPTPVLSQVLMTPFGAADFAVARDGTLVYLPGAIVPAARTLAWVDRQGREEPIKAPVRAYVYPRLSPDGSRVALDIRDQDNDIWIWDFAREALTRLTFDPTADRLPVWSPDGHRILFNSSRSGPGNLFSQAADGTGVAQRLTENKNEQFPTTISPDGTRLVFYEATTTTDLMSLDVDTGRVQPLVQTPADERNAEISPDGRWVAYQSNETGQYEIYVRPFPDVSSGHWQVSTGGGTRPLWSGNGQELFYVTPSGQLMGVRVDREARWTAGTPMKVLEGPYFFGGGAFAGRTYDVARDGRRFLMIKPVGGSERTSTPASVVVVQNWFEELKRLVPTK